MISLMVYDFDGVMTDNKVTVSEDGTESVVCNRSDGLGVKIISALGIDQLILSTETNRVVAKRAEKLRIDVIHGSFDKKTSLLAHCNSRDIELIDVGYVGNDLNDLEAMKLCGRTFAPYDAHHLIKKWADHIMYSRGGEGVIREIAELLSNDIKRI